MTQRAGYNELNRMNRKQGNVGQHPIVIQEKALGFVQARKKKAVLSVGYWMSKKGEFALTVAMVAGGHVLNSPSLDAMAAGMGAVLAAHWLIDHSRQANSGKNTDGVAYDAAALAAFEHNPDAISGRWE